METERTPQPNSHPFPACEAVYNETKNAFEAAYKMWSQRSENISSISIGNVRLYSYASPKLQSDSLEADKLWNHLSPSRIRDRLHHADKKDILYFDSAGNVFRPGLEIRLSTADDAYRLREGLSPLTPAHSSSLSPLWRILIRAVEYVLKMRRSRAGEKVLAFYSAEDCSYFGSVYINKRGQYSSIQARDRESVERGIRTISSLLCT